MYAVLTLMLLIGQCTARMENLSDVMSVPKLKSEETERQYVVLFHVAAGRNPLLTSEDAEVITRELQHEEVENESHSTLYDCLKQRNDYCWAKTSCINLQLSTKKTNMDQHNSVSHFNENCNVLIYWLNETLQESANSDANGKPSAIEVWSYGLICTMIISLSGVGGILLYPLMNRGYSKEVMNFLIGLAFGSLSATSIFQLIPESLNVMEHDKDYLLKSLICWISIWCFYNIGAITCIIGGNGKHSHHPTIEDDGNNSQALNQIAEVALEMTEHTSPEVEEEKVVENKEFLCKRNGTSLVEGQPKFQNPRQLLTKKATAGMILFGDSLHNLVDGMSIGAAFTQNLSTGFSICLGVACEEFPHELGDFAVLIKSGYSFKKALKFNYASASTIFLGLIIGILLGQMESSIYIYTFAAGLFLYISLGELVPELKGMILEEKEQGIKYSLIAFSLQNFGMLIGSTALFLVSYFY